MLFLLAFEHGSSIAALEATAAPSSEPQVSAARDGAVVPAAGDSAARDLATLDAANIHVLGGLTWTNDEESFALEVSFERRLSDWFSIEGAYDNEGHFTSHHRDSLAVQLFAQQRFWNQRTRLRAGVGPLLYFDTRTSNNGQSDTDAHGIGLLATLAAEVDLVHGFFVEGRINGAIAQNDFSSGQALFGLGYHLGPSLPRESDAERDPLWANTRLYLLGGESVRNSFAAQKGFAVMAGIGRDDIVSVVGARLFYLRLGSEDNRQGAALQLSAEAHYFDNWLILSAHVGPYLYFDDAGGGPSAGVAGLVGPQIGCEIVPGLQAILTAMREFGNRDYDIVLIGLSAEF